MNSVLWIIQSNGELFLEKDVAHLFGSLVEVQWQQNKNIYMARYH